MIRCGDERIRAHGCECDELAILLPLLLLLVDVSAGEGGGGSGSEFATKLAFLVRSVTYSRKASLELCGMSVAQVDGPRAWRASWRVVMSCHVIY